MKITRPLFLIGLLLCLSACGVIDRFTYKLSIQQGNYLEQKDIDKLRPGMTRDQVLFVLGDPMVRSSFSDTRWEYQYWLRVDERVAKKKNLTLFFKDDLLEKLEGDFNAPEVFAANH